MDFTSFGCYGNTNKFENSQPYLPRLIYIYIENNGFLDAFVKMKHLRGIYLRREA